MVGGNLQSKHNEIRAEIEYETTVKAEREIGQLLLITEKIEDQLNQLLESKKRK